MKTYSIFSIICYALFLNSCNKTDFKESKIAVTVPSAQEQNAPSNMPAPSSSSELPPGHPPIDKSSTPNEMTPKTMGKIKKVDGGVTVVECFTNKISLNGKTVTLRGRVVKYNSGILKRNWLHLQDGSGSNGQNDLAVTTTDSAKLNDIVVVTGTIHYDKDIGSGYFFPVIIEDAKVKIEK